MGSIVKMSARKKTKFFSSKHLYIFIIFILALSLLLIKFLYFPVRGYDLGELNWMTSREALINYELKDGNKEYKESTEEDKTFGYLLNLIDFKNTTAYNRTAEVKYVFLNNKLVACAYSFDVEGEKEAEDLAADLSKKYGEPVQAYIPAASQFNHGEGSLRHLFWKPRRSNVTFICSDNKRVNLFFEDSDIFSKSRILNNRKFELGFYKGL